MPNEFTACVCQENEVLERGMGLTRVYLLELIDAPEVSGGMGLTRVTR